MSNKPPAPSSMASRCAAVDAADAASADPAASCSRGEHEDPSPPPGFAPLIHEPPPSSSSTPRRTSFPISFPPIFFQLSKAPSATLVPSTAEGKAVPLTNATDSHRTSALQKLNSKYPSAVRRHGYAPEACGAQSSTYSQPVLVRTYSGPPPSQGSRSTRSPQYRPPSSSRGASKRVPLPPSPIPGQPAHPTVSGVGVGTTSGSDTGLASHSTAANDRHVHEVTMPRSYKPPKPASNGGSKLSLSRLWQMSARQEPEEPKLPTMEDFSFKSFMADLQGHGGENDIGADLDRIAEICARSRYSLSNQYEVHVAPHGSGASFVSGSGPSPSSAPRRKGHSHSHSRSRSHGHGVGGPTLQAIPSDDEASARSQPRRRNNGRRRSAAYGTLETIMSSSRSSEEDKAKKKSAAELVGEVRGRAARKTWENPSGSGSGSGGSASASASASTGNGGAAADAQAGQQQGAQQPPTAEAAQLARKKSASFATAIMDSSGHSSARTTTTTTTAASTSSSSHRRHTTTAGASRTTKSAVPSSALLSEPARPQMSNSHLGVRTTRDASHIIMTPHTPIPGGGGGAVGDIKPPHQLGLPSSHAGQAPPQAGSWGAWIPWRTTGQQQEEGRQGGEGGVESGVDQLQQQQQTSPLPLDTTTTGRTAAAAAATAKLKTAKTSHAEGSLRQLLKLASG